MKVEYLDKLSIQQIKEQVYAVLNYTPNILGGDKFDLASVLSNFHGVLLTYTSLAFSESLKNSEECIINKKSYSDCINTLKIGDKNSFLLVPLLSQDHLFSLFLQKEDMDTFSATIINKGDRPSSVNSYMKYKIPKDSLYKIIDVMGFKNRPSLSTSMIYDVFLSIDNNPDYLPNITSLPQKEGNCFFKEIEAGLKYAFSNAKYENFTTPKWPLSTFKAHMAYITNIEETRPELKGIISNITSIFVQNKMFRNSLKENPDASFLNKEKLFLSQFFYSDTNPVSECLKNVDKETLEQNYQFFSTLCDTHGLFYHKFIMNSLAPFLNSNGDFNVYKENHMIFELYFPAIASELNASYSQNISQNASLYVNAAENSLDINDMVNNYTRAINMYHMALSLYPDDPNAFSNRGYCCSKLNMTDAAEINYLAAITLCPSASKYHNQYMAFLFDNNRFEDAKVRHNKFKEIDQFDPLTIEREKIYKNNSLNLTL